ncbi:MAG: leucine-rich repeat domain-containing protein [Coprobacillus sp.]|nr:leucine-rich repeat domain-containing protein [Coprobacillus sp.]
MKRLKTLTTALCAVVLSLGLATTTTSCDKTNTYEWEVTDTISARFEDDGYYGFTLVVEGEGAMPDYVDDEGAPWSYRWGRVTGVEIGEGITHIGTWSFYGCNITKAIIPSTATSIGSMAFKEEVELYGYSEDFYSDDGTIVYVYSSERHTEGGIYWRFKNGEPELWSSVTALFIGNSFTYYNDIPALFQEIANAAGEEVYAESITEGSHTLAQFADPTDERGAEVEEALTTNQYDVIVLQEHSTRPATNYNLYKDAVATLQTRINETQENCEIYLYATWGYQEAANDEPSVSTIPEYEMLLRNATEQCASELGLKVCEVGKAFTYVYENSDINLYYSDNKHPSYFGSYLSACVHAATILNCDVRETTYLGDTFSRYAARCNDGELTALAYYWLFDEYFNAPIEHMDISGEGGKDNSLVIAWYDKVETSGLNADYVNEIKNELSTYLATQGYTDVSIEMRAYDGNVGPSCQAIMNDGDVDIMLGWASNIGSTGGMSQGTDYIENNSGIEVSAISQKTASYLQNVAYDVVFNS